MHALGESAGRPRRGRRRPGPHLPPAGPRKDRGRPSTPPWWCRSGTRSLYEPDGALADDLAAGPRRSPTAAGSARSSTSGSPPATDPLTWLVDPAVIDAVRRLADGNPPRSLADLGRPGRRRGRRSGVGRARRRTSDRTSDGRRRRRRRQRARPGGQDRRRGGRAGLAGPAPARDAPAGPGAGACRTATSTWRPPPTHDPRRLRRARGPHRRRARRRPGPDDRAVAASPSGYLDDAAADPAGRRGHHDPAHRPGDVRGAGAGRGRRTTATAWSSPPPTPATGGPGPDDRARPGRDAAAASSARRRCGFLRAGRPPLVDGVPARLGPPTGPDYAAFFDGLDVDWLRPHLGGRDRRPGRARRSPADRSLPGLAGQTPSSTRPNFASADGLTAPAHPPAEPAHPQRPGRRGTVTDEAFGNVVLLRPRADAVRVPGRDPTRPGWIDGPAAVGHVDAPAAVILSSGSGRFSGDRHQRPRPTGDGAASTRTSDPPLTITGARPARARPANASTSRAAARASTDENGIHDVTLLLTDTRGTPLGASDEPHRSARPGQQRDLAVPRHRRARCSSARSCVRLFRRIRRRGAADDADDGSDAGPSRPSRRPRAASRHPVTGPPVRAAR